MRALLDTHVLLWAWAEPERIPVRAREVLEDGASELLWSPIGTAEIAVKAARGKLRLPGSVASFVEQQRSILRFVHLPLEHRHAATLADLPPVHGDPFDRLLVAQALAEGLPLLTSDVGLRAYGIEVIW